jgi:hypothetical protein
LQQLRPPQLPSPPPTPYSSPYPDLQPLPANKQRQFLPRPQTRPGQPLHSGHPQRHRHLPDLLLHCFPHCLELPHNQQQLCRHSLFRWHLHQLLPRPDHHHCIGSWQYLHQRSHWGCSHLYGCLHPQRIYFNISHNHTQLQHCLSWLLGSCHRHAHGDHPSDHLRQPRLPTRQPHHPRHPLSHLRQHRSLPHHCHRHRDHPNSIRPGLSPPLLLPLSLHKHILPRLPNHLNPHSPTVRSPKHSHCHRPRKFNHPPLLLRILHSGAGLLLLRLVTRPSVPHPWRQTHPLIFAR